MNGLTSAASGMLADERLQQVLMNNISNLSTPGFKESTGSLMAFPEMLLQSYNYANSQPSGSVGTVNNGVFFQQNLSNFSQGGISSTGQPFDLAIQDPLPQGAYVYTLNGGAGNGKAQAAMTNTLSIVIGPGGVLETAKGTPILPVDANGQPIAGARVVANPKYKGTDLIGTNGSPVYDASGQPSFHIQFAKGQSVQGASVYYADASTSGLHSLFAVENVTAAGKSEVALTRDGHFQVGSNHFLYNSLGQRVLAIGANGQPDLNSAILINPKFQGHVYFGVNGAPVRDAQGQLSYQVVQSNGQPLAGAKFGVTDVNISSLQTLGATDYLPTSSTLYATSQAALHVGALESSNASGTQNLVDMQSIYGSYQADQKIIQTISQTTKLAVSQVGSVAGL